MARCVSPRPDLVPTYCLVRWQGLGGGWARGPRLGGLSVGAGRQHLTNCAERVHRPRAHQRAGTAPLTRAAALPSPAPPPHAPPRGWLRPGPRSPLPPGWGGGGCEPAGPRLRPHLLVAAGTSGRGGLQRLGRIRCGGRCRRARAQLTNVVGFKTPTVTFAGEVDTILDPASMTRASQAAPLRRSRADRRTAGVYSPPKRPGDFRQRTPAGSAVSYLSGKTVDKEEREILKIFDCASELPVLLRSYGLGNAF